MINSENSTNPLENTSTAANRSESEVVSPAASEILSLPANEIMLSAENEVVSPTDSEVMSSVASEDVSPVANEFMTSPTSEIVSSPVDFSPASEIMSPPTNEIISSAASEVMTTVASEDVSSVANEIMTSPTSEIMSSSTTEIMTSVANEVMSSSDIMSDNISTAEIESVISDSSSHLQQSLVDGLTTSCRDLTLGMQEVVTKVQMTLSNISAITVANVQTCGSSVASLDVTIADSCKSMYSLIASVGELDKEMAPVAELAAKVQRIKTVLTALEDNL